VDLIEPGVVPIQQWRPDSYLEAAARAISSGIGLGAADFIAYPVLERTALPTLKSATASAAGHPHEGCPEFLGGHGWPLGILHERSVRCGTHLSCGHVQYAPGSNFVIDL
jgi:hypothetical protein